MGGASLRIREPCDYHVTQVAFGGIDDTLSVGRQRSFTRACRMSGCDFDDAMLAVQEAAGKITSVSAQIGNFEGKQDELLESVKVLSERVANLEDAARSSSRAGGKR